MIVAPKLHLVRPAAPETPPVPPEFEYDPVSHIYKINGERVPGVTTVLKAVGISDYSRIGLGAAQQSPPPDFKSWSAYYLWRGSANHAAASLIVNEREAELAEWLARMEEQGFAELRGYVDAIKRFMFESRFLPLLSEQQVYHVALRYAGTLDLAGWLPLTSTTGNLCLLDWKTTEAPPSTAVQLAGYQYALASTEKLVSYPYAHRHHDRVAVPIRKNGTYGKPEFYYDTWDLDLWLGALSIVHWRQRHYGGLF